MATTSWTPGNGVGATPTACFASADLASMISGDSVLSSEGDIGNDAALDLYAIVSFQLAIGSTTLVAGAGVYLSLFPKFEIDGSDSYYGDNSLPAGTPKAWIPPNGLVGAFSSSITGAGQTLVTGQFPPIWMPPEKLRFVFTNNLSVTLGSGTQYCSYTTWNLKSA